jgi:hypothetical protein
MYFNRCSAAMIFFYNSLIDKRGSREHWSVGETLIVHVCVCVWLYMCGCVCVCSLHLCGLPFFMLFLQLTFGKAVDPDQNFWNIPSIVNFPQLKVLHKMINTLTWCRKHPPQTQLSPAQLACAFPWEQTDVLQRQSCADPSRCVCLPMRRQDGLRHSK